ncbi:hypothetical protein DVA86_26180 [Streptomyces armeniacus]|uniref:Lipase maturation factor family protein n=1 Tax=Streptomyces armeniacus TaxID=83291 RepID=A0A345XVE1_9ACTN|nr:hypothetical protein [Streptomyces armeniacus]AXK35607.1 hypothetical protein DVA86_26180 [Streptomyces armeniacus]
MAEALAEHTSIAINVAATASCYRFAISPGVRALSRRLERPPDRRRRITAAVVTGLAVLTPAGLAALQTPPSAGPARWLLLAVLALLTWKFSTTDYDLTRPLALQRRARRLLVLLAFGGAVWPPLLLCWLALACGRLHGWQHHAMMPLRLLKAYVAWYVAALLLTGAVSPSAAQDGLLLTLCCVALSHYLKAAWSKARLGPHWWSWSWHNRTHCLIASAYSWGWARFLPPRTATTALRTVQPLNRPLNVAAMAVELSPLLAFSHRWALIASLAATAMFNTVVALTSGILFWENICANVGLALTVATWPRDMSGWPSTLFALALLLLAVADRIWQPWHLGWWDTPFTARIHWEVRTAGGRRLGLYNSFMCPYEREFGRVLGYFLSEEPILHGHLGTVFDHELRDRILDADADPEALARLKQLHGHVHADPAQAGRHLDFLRTTFSRLNSGAPKGPLTGRLRRLKAPGGQLFSWGDLPPYRGDEPVDRIAIRYEERYYRSRTREFVVLTDQPLLELDITPTATEPTRSTRAKDLR